MTKRMSRVLALAFGALLTVGLVGCGNSGSQSKSEPVKITYWHRMTGAWNKAQQKTIDAFNKSQSKYKVVATSQGSYDALQQKLMAAAKSKTLPVMAQAPTTNIGDYVKNDFLIPWDSQMLHGSNKLSAAQLSDIYPSFLKAGEYKGKYYGLPYSESTQVLFYNETLMKKYNLAMPKTWDDIEKMGPALKKEGLATLAMDQSYDVQLEGMAMQAGHKLITADGKANLNAPTTLAAVDKILSLRKAGYVKTAGTDYYFTVAFSQQKAVFGIGSSSSIGSVQAPKGMQWGTATVPSFANDSVAEPLNGNDNVLFKGASKAQQQGAWAFQKFLLKKQNAAYWAKKSGYVPITKSATQSATYRDYLKANPTFKAAVDASDTAFASTVFAGYGDYRNDLMDTVDSTISKGTSGKDAFDALQKKTEAILKENQN
ncbi:ABC transporter substrate-binding protein [Lacticaseibacillus sp. 53-4]|uniref:ABC transporter substrate-binding protein n=1 Tax=Lacticaseibacillus sp. 53-4 TaxID=2799575 RepID=UPI0019444544